MLRLLLYAWYVPTAAHEPAAPQEMALSQASGKVSPLAGVAISVAAPHTPFVSETTIACPSEVVSW
jgi:hypothetical protein